MEIFVLTVFWIYIVSIIVNTLSMLPKNSVSPVVLIALLIQMSMAIWAGVLLWGN